MRYVLFGLVMALGCGLAIPSAARAEQGQLVAKSDIPRDASDTANQMANNVDWLLAFKFENDGKPYYRIIGKNTQMRTVIAEVSPEGKPIWVRTCVPYQDVPEAARRALRNTAPGFEPKDGDLAVQACGYNANETIMYQFEGSLPGNSEATFFVKADGSKVVDGNAASGPAS